MSERAEKTRVELESMDIRLEEEKKRSAELLLQVTLGIARLTCSHALLCSSFSFFFID